MPVVTSARSEHAPPSPPPSVVCPSASVHHSRLWWLVAIFMTASLVMVTVEVPKRAPPTPTAAADQVILLPPTMGLVYEPDLRPVPKGQGILLGPHFVLVIDGVAVTPKIDETAARRLGMASALRAAEGQELLFVDLSTRPDVVPRFTRSGVELTTAVVVNGLPRPLDGQLIKGRLLVISVPVGAPAALVVTDEGRDLSMNLRNGFVDADSLYEVQVSEDLSASKYAGTGTIRAATVSRPLNVSVGFTERASLDPFLTGLGWAGRGRAWLHVSGVQAQADGFSGWDRRKGEFPAKVTLDTSATFRMKLPDGTLVRPQPAPPLDLSDFSPLPGFYLIFSVPDSFRTGSVQITPQGNVTALYSDGDLPATWTAPPAAGEVAITMKP